MALIKFSTPPTLAGFFFCLASAEGAGLLFLPGGVSAKHKRLQHSLYHPCKIIPPKHQKPLQGFTVAFPLIWPIPAHPIQQPHKPPIHRLRHAGGHTVKRCTSTDTRHHRRTGTLYRSVQPHIIIRYTRVRHCYGSMPDSAAHRRPCQPGGGSVHPACIRCRGQTGGLSALPALSGLQSGTGQQSGRTLHPEGQSSSNGAAGGAEPLTACRRISFRAFAR